MDAEKVNRVEKQLDHHLNNRKCERCTVKGKSYADCFDNLFTDALSVIRELKAENERLMKEKADAVSEIKKEQELNTPSEPIGDYLTSEVINFNYQLGYQDGLQKALDLIKTPI